MHQDPKDRVKSEESFKKVQGRLRLAYAEEDPSPISILGLTQEHFQLLKEAWGRDLTFDGDSCFFAHFA